MIELILITAGIYAGLFLATKGVTFKVAFKPFRIGLRMLRKCLRGMGKPRQSS